MSFEQFFRSYIAVLVGDKLLLLLAAICVISISMIVLYKNTGLGRRTVLLLWMALIYLALIYFITVFTRSREEGSIRLIPFASVVDAVKYQSVTIVQYNLLNVLLLMPFAVLIEEACSLEKAKKMILWITLLSGSISLSIELLQLVLKCGVFETDDIITNTLGAFLGAGVVYLLRKKRQKNMPGRES